MPQHDKSRLDKAYDLINNEEDARVCKDIPDAACHHQPKNFFAYLIANFLGKIADELASAKLTLPWLLGALGTPAVFTGFLVPIREAGVLLPQLFVAAAVRHLPVRKGVWLLGAALSAIALAVMALTAGWVSGVAAGWAIIVSLVVFSLARGLCSVSAKDVLGKTISKGRRGNLMGISSGIAGVATLGVGVYIEFFSQNPSSDLLAGLLWVGAILWAIAFVVFAQIEEHPGATEGGGNAFAAAFKSFALLKTDRPFRQYVIGRALLLSTALAPPFYVLLAQQYSENDLSGLGMLIIASGIAGAISAPVWGKMGDRSSRFVMILASLSAGILGIVLFALAESDSPWLSNPLVHAGFFLLLTVFYSGVRLGRKVYLVDLANADNRATYVALSNTVIGLAMLAGGAIGLLADILSIQVVILVLSVIAVLAALWIARLPEVSD
ncbi:MFS transporter [Hydrogenovibrio thermophilus]|uniref:MFS transporter n=1 Tax=Hydrogenovibrio thermophilus TaxID=265883 RepID=A0A451G432_9GAMM|nr:MFS transporter [Hydrogenovibrio thermophilus]QAB14215.1 MFS transporter [Hydrogenovibrio thermophilus]